MTEVTLATPAVSDNQAHIDAMVAKADGVTPPPTQVTPTDRPAWLPEKFKSAEDMAKAYSELEKKSSLPKDPATPETPETPADATPPADVEKAVEAAGLNLDDVEVEFQKEGKLSDATYEALQKAGYDRTRVDSYIAGQQALATQLQSRVETHVGGAEVLSSMLEWAGKGGLTADEIAAFNTSIDKASEAGVKLAMDGLRSKFETANGRDPVLLGGGPNAIDGDVFRSTKELTTAMSDPRYAKDPAYRADIEAKVARSSIF